jgi:pimeloyl-ACP methyl ester carboxylesterase
VVLLHGILASGVYWTDVATKISGRRVIAFDLLGFGSSPRPKPNEYAYDDHVQAIVAALTASDVRGPVTLVGHSMGALIALRLAAERPDLVRNLVLIGMPIYSSATEARAVVGSTWIRRKLIYGPTARLFCSIWCQLLKPISRRAAPSYLRNMPAAVARASIEHSWRSFSRSLASIVEIQSVATDIARLVRPTLIVSGDQDAYSHPTSNLSRPEHVHTVTLSGGHQLPIEKAAEIADLIQDAPSDTSARTSQSTSTALRGA